MMVLMGWNRSLGWDTWTVHIQVRDDMVGVLGEWIGSRIHDIQGQTGQGWMLSWVVT